MTSTFFGLEGEIVEPFNDGGHGGSLHCTLERPDIDSIKRSLVAKEGHLFAITLGLEQLFVWTEKLIVNHGSKPSFRSIELLDDTTFKPQIVVDGGIALSDMTDRIVAQEMCCSHKAFRVVENPAWIEQVTWIQEISTMLVSNSPIFIVLIDAVLLVPCREPRFQHTEIEEIFVAGCHETPHFFQRHIVDQASVVQNPEPNIHTCDTVLFEFDQFFLGFSPVTRAQHFREV